MYIFLWIVKIKSLLENQKLFLLLLFGDKLLELSFDCLEILSFVGYFMGKVGGCVLLAQCSLLASSFPGEVFVNGFLENLSGGFWNSKLFASFRMEPESDSDCLFSLTVIQTCIWYMNRIRSSLGYGGTLRTSYNKYKKLLTLLILILTPLTVIWFFFLQTLVTLPTLFLSFPAITLTTSPRKIVHFWNGTWGFLLGLALSRLNEYIKGLVKREVNLGMRDRVRRKFMTLLLSLVNVII